MDNNNGYQEPQYTNNQSGSYQQPQYGNYDQMQNGGYQQPPQYQPPQYQPPMQPMQQPSHGMAVASLVLGILGLVCCGSLVASVLAIIFSQIAKKHGNTESIAQAGFILGIVGAVIGVIAIIVSSVGGVSYTEYFNY